MTHVLPAGTPGLHTAVEPFGVRDGCLCVGGETVSDIMADVGDVPAYLYDRALIRRRVEQLRSALPRGISLHFAMKANPMPEVVNFVAPLVDGLDIASAGELSVAAKTDTPRADMSFAGPGKKPAELAAAIEAGITINVESPGELETIGRLAGNGKRPRVAIRVNPDFELKSSGMRMSGGPKPFGIDAEQVPAVLRRTGELEVDFIGFHIFSGAQNLNPEPICESQRKALELALELSRHAPAAPTSINIGGGFGIPYFPGDAPLELESITANLTDVQRRLREIYPDCELVVELGRYIVGEAGLYICHIVDKKVSRERCYLVTDGGLHHHLSVTGNFGQVIRKNYPLVIANRLAEQETETVSVVGPLCTPLDLLGDRMELNKAGIGDLVAVFQSGAYGYTASPHLFLSHPAPQQLLL